MARIRSIHPGIWTDEAFMKLSAYARLLFVGLWTEAFDDGVFDWKPLTLKARIFPVDAVDVEALLDELVGVGVIARVDDHERKPGAIRNFQKFQRPKKPNGSGMLTKKWVVFVGGSVPVTNQSGTGTEEVAQMEDGGGRGEEEESSEPIGSGAEAPIDFEKLAFERGKAVLGPSAGGVIAKLKRDRCKTWSETLGVIEEAAKKQAPMEWVQGILRRKDPEEPDPYRNVDCSPPTPEEIERWKAQGLS